VVADVGHLLAASVAGPWPPDPGEGEGLLVGALEPVPTPRRPSVCSCRARRWLSAERRNDARGPTSRATGGSSGSGSWFRNRRLAWNSGKPQGAATASLSVSSLVQFVDEVPLGRVELLTGFDYLGAALGHRRIEGRDIHAVDDSFIGLADPPSPRYFPNLSHAKSAEGDSMQPEPRFSRCYAPIDLTADVPAGQRPVRVYKLPGRAFLCADGSEGLSRLHDMTCAKHI
jgi:hypothetical protein